MVQILTNDGERYRKMMNQISKAVEKCKYSLLRIRQRCGKTLVNDFKNQISAGTLLHNREAIYQATAFREGVQGEAIASLPLPLFGSFWRPKKNLHDVLSKNIYNRLGNFSRQLPLILITRQPSLFFHIR